MTKPFAKRGARPLIENPDLARTLVKSLLKVSKDKRFTIDKMKSTTVLRKVFADDEVDFEKLCMEAISSNKNENENVNDLELAVIKVPAACDLGAPNGPFNHFKDVILPMMIAGEGDFQFNNEDEKAAILAVLELKIEGETIIDLKTNAPRKTAAEKQREREQQPEKKEKKREYNQMYNQRDDVKAKKREYEQRDDVKEMRREYDQRDDVKAKRSANGKELRKYWIETGHVVNSNALKRHVPINVYDKELRKHWIENEHVVNSKALGGRDVPINVYEKLRKRVEKERILRMMQAHQSMNHSSCANSGCDCHVSPKWFTLSDMKNELILRCELAGITRTEEQFRRKLERMFTPVVSTAMTENEEMYFCLECKEKEFFKVGKRLQRVDEK